jgi:hypothetical protein
MFDHSTTPGPACVPPAESVREGDSPGWSNADATPVPLCAEPAQPPPDSHFATGYYIAFSFGTKDFNRSGGFT